MCEVNCWFSRFGIIIINWRYRKVKRWFKNLTNRCFLLNFCHRCINYIPIVTKKRHIQYFWGLVWCGTESMPPSAFDCWFQVSQLDGQVQIQEQIIRKQHSHHSFVSVWSKMPSSCCRTWQSLFDFCIKVFPQYWHTLLSAFCSFCNCSWAQFFISRTVIPLNLEFVEILVLHNGISLLSYQTKVVCIYVFHFMVKPFFRPITVAPIGEVFTARFFPAREHLALINWCHVWN